MPVCPAEANACAAQRLRDQTSIVLALSRLQQTQTKPRRLRLEGLRLAVALAAARRRVLALAAADADEDEAASASRRCRLLLLDDGGPAPSTLQPSGPAEAVSGCVSTPSMVSVLRLVCVKGLAASI